MRSSNVAVWSGHVAVSSGNVVVAKTYIWNCLEISKKTFRKQKSFFRKTYFSSKRQNFSTILKMQVHIGLCDIPSGNWDVCQCQCQKSFSGRTIGLLSLFLMNLIKKNAVYRMCLIKEHPKNILDIQRNHS